MTGVEEHVLRLAEAVIFASPDPVTPQALARALPLEVDVGALIAALAARHAGRGVQLAQVAGGVRFETAEDLAPELRRMFPQPRRLPRAATETLALIAYCQPVTRREIEAMRGASLSQQTIDVLLEAGLIAPRGQKEVPGRPLLWATTAAFLARFGLDSLDDLPPRGELLPEPFQEAGGAAAPPPPPPPPGDAT